jgi:hypothetical protein
MLLIPIHSQIDIQLDPGSTVSLVVRSTKEADPIVIKLDEDDMLRHHLLPIAEFIRDEVF